MSHEILYNEVALRSLKRQQLVQLCKRYGLRAAGKNVELISRLQGYGASLPLEERNAADETTVTTQEFDEMPESSDESSSSSDGEDGNDQNRDTLNDATSRRIRESSIMQNAQIRQAANPSKLSVSSDTWDMLNGENEARDERSEHAPMDLPDSVSSWKSARNGESHVGGKSQTTEGMLTKSRSLKSRVGTIKSVGSSLNLRLRNASSSSLGSLKRKASVRSALNNSRTAAIHPTRIREELQQDEEVLSGNLASASAIPSVGIPRRHGHMLGSTAPSTIRMISGTGRPSSECDPTQSGHPQPSTGANDVPGMPVPSPKTTPTLKPFCRYPVKGSPLLNKKSTNVQLETPRSSGVHTPNDDLYPTMPMETEDDEDHPQFPGAFPTPPSKRKEPFVFGSNRHTAGITNDQFGLAGDPVLEEMNRKLQARGIASIGQTIDKEEVLRQKAAEGRSFTGSLLRNNRSKGRFEEAHARQFARMPSIMSGLNDKTARPIIRKTASTGTLLRKATENSTSVGQMTPGKRKASDMDCGDLGGSASFAGSGPLSSAGPDGISLEDAAVEDSPRIKRMRVTPSDSRCTDLSRLSKERISADKKEVTETPKSRLGFLTASTNSLKATVSALHRRISNGPESALNLATKQQRMNPQPQPQRLVKSRSHHGLATTSSTNLGSVYTERDVKPPLNAMTRIHPSKSVSTDLHASNSANAAICNTPETGLSLAYDLHVRKSKSSQALDLPSRNTSNSVHESGTYSSLSTSRNGSLHAATNRAGLVGSSSLGYGYRSTGRPAPLPPRTGALPRIDSPQGLSSSGVPGKSDDMVRTSRPLPALPVGIVRSQSSNLLRPTASSLARMQATVQPPSLTAGTPSAPRIISNQRTPFNRGIPTPSLAKPIPRMTGMLAGSPHKKTSYLVPKSPHRRAMERHTAAGRVVGGGVGSGLKSVASQASLAMSQKQREIENRRRARAIGGTPLF